MEELVGKKINRVFMNDEYLKFDTDQGEVCYTVDGDCCSRSYFYDFHGVDRLINNGPIISVEEIELDDVDTEDQYDVTTAYGYRLITEDPKFGEVSSVMSFRNDSNGYYGGSLESTIWTPDLPEIKTDWLGE